jgi:hypothetical protein
LLPLLGVEMTYTGLYTEDDDDCTCTATRLCDNCADREQDAIDDDLYNLHLIG